ADGVDNSGAGAFYIPFSAKAKSILEKDASTLGMKISGVSKKPTTGMTKVSTQRIALWDTYGGSMPSGWVRWLMEQYHFNVDIIYPKNVDAGGLRDKYDVIIFVHEEFIQNFF